MQTVCCVSIISERREFLDAVSVMSFWTVAPGKFEHVDDRAANGRFSSTVCMKTCVSVLTIDRARMDRCFLSACYRPPLIPLPLLREATLLAPAALFSPWHAGCAFGRLGALVGPSTTRSNAIVSRTLARQRAQGEAA